MSKLTGSLFFHVLYYVEKTLREILRVIEKEKRMFNLIESGNIKSVTKFN